MGIESLSKFLKIAKKIDSLIEKSKKFNIESKDLRLKSGDGLLEYSLIAIPQTASNTKGKISFSDIDLHRISIMSYPGFSENQESISRIEGDLTKSFSLDVEKLRTIKCKIDSIVKDLVRRDHQIDSADDEENTYWLHAQIRKLKDLKDALRKVDLLDIPFAVNVAVHQDIKTKFPTRRRRELELIAKWAHEHDRNKKQLISMEHLKLKRKRPKEKEITNVLRDLQNLFIPFRFKSYIEVLKDFNYYDCQRGADFYDKIPFRTFPKWMAVISRTDLTIEKPVSKGELVYKKGLFQESIEKALTKK